ncbi:MAG: 3D domain-containing protein [Candidatus Pacebacteria bacterium]|nr:3D domain-containing protein [Candidatus Paceibacterota bacterium]
MLEQLKATKSNWLKTLTIYFFVLIFLSVFPFFESHIRNIMVVSAEPVVYIDPESFTSFQDNTLVSTIEIFINGTGNIVKTIPVVVTAYSSTVAQTDSTPFITASGNSVRPGIVAANFLPFGTKITIPEIYGNDVFTVEDRMHPRNNYHVDIWFPNYLQAKNFGKEITYVEVLEN